MSKYKRLETHKCFVVHLLLREVQDGEEDFVRVVLNADWNLS